MNFPLGWVQGWGSTAQLTTAWAASVADSGESSAILLWADPGWMALK